MNLLLLGNTGQLGWELQRTLQPLGAVVALDYPVVDMSDAASIRRAVRESSPRIIVNATAYTVVDKAETELELAGAINGTGPGVLAEEARGLDAILVHYSTDYVFDGSKGAPYKETDLVSPVNFYGQSKLAGEQAILSADGNHMIFRTAWVYSLRRDSFVTKVLGWAREKEILRVVDDQVSNPTWARMLAEITAQVLSRGEGYLRERTGLYHLAGGGHASRFAWAREILRLDPGKQDQKVKQLLPAASSDFPTPARRPLFSALDCQKFEQTFSLSLPAWDAALALAMA
jgi:dTDP-4-dehydrorhamnose reductase